MHMPVLIRLKLIWNWIYKLAADRVAGGIVTKWNVSLNAAFARHIKDASCVH